MDWRKSIESLPRVIIQPLGRVALVALDCLVIILCVVRLFLWGRAARFVDEVLEGAFMD